jgi:hypothetical protein
LGRILERTRHAFDEMLAWSLDPALRQQIAAEQQQLREIINCGRLILHALKGERVQLKSVNGREIEGKESF